MGIEVGHRIRTARRQAGMSLAQLGAAVGLSVSALSLIERGLRERINYDTMVAIARALGTDAAHLSLHPVSTAQQELRDAHTTTRRRRRRSASRSV